MSDWIFEAALEIAARSEDSPPLRGVVVQDIIRKHCPSELDRWLSTPRCATCLHWDRDEITIMNTAECTLASMSAIIETSGGDVIKFQMRTKADFGCTNWEAKKK
jgi:hypothetical protein